MAHPEIIPLLTPYGNISVSLWKKSSHRPPIIIVPGWGECMKSINAFAQNISHALDRTVYAIDYTQLQPLSHTKNSTFCSSLPPTSLTEKIRAFCIHKLLLTHSDAFANGIHMISHSEGSMAASLATLHHYQYIRTHTMIAPAGFTHHTLHTLAPRFLSSFSLRYAQSHINNDKNSIKYYMRATQYIIRHLPRLLLDAYGIAHTKTLPIIARTAEKNIALHAILYRDDKLFDRHILQQIRKYATIHYINGTHAQNHTHPEETIAILNMIISLN